MNKIEFKSPFDIYGEAVELINSESVINQSNQNYLCKISSLTFPPPTVEAIKFAANLLYRMNVINDQNAKKSLEDMNSFQQGTHGFSHVKKYSIQEYPVFAALQKFDRKQWPCPDVKYLSFNLYIFMFELKKLKIDGLDPMLFYDDAYFCRDVFLHYLDDFIFSAGDCVTLIQFKNSMLKQCSSILTDEKTGTIKFKKINRFLEILTGIHIPGERQRKKTTRINTPKNDIESILPDPSNGGDGAGYDVSYPDIDSNIPKSYTRSTPPSGSKLTYVDDKRSIRGRANAQAASNIPLITDMHRVPFPCISVFFSYLVTIKLQLLAYYWILITTNIQPERLFTLEIRSGKRPRNQHGLYIDIDTAILSYEVINRNEDNHHDLMQLNISKEILNYISEYGNGHPFQDMRSEIEKVLQKFSLHNPGQSPTPDRVAASCIINFSEDHFSEIESAYMSGNIPPRLRAQAHYYPIDTQKINQKYRNAHNIFIRRLVNSESSTSLSDTFFRTFKAFKTTIPEGIIGSVDSISIISLQAVLDKLNTLLITAKTRFQSSHPMEKLHKFSQLIEIQHLQLFIIEQLAFCARKFGEKTSYAVGFSIGKIWGSEKASAGASIERKLVPVTKLLEKQLSICEVDMTYLAGLATKLRYSIESDFNIRTNPLPVVIKIDDDQRQIKLGKMHSKEFHSLLEGMNVNDMPKPSSPKVNIFKHIMAGSLLNKIPQILIDEIMTHDRDGLDFCSNYGTGSAISMSLASEAIETIFAGLNFQLISLGDRK